MDGTNPAGVPKHWRLRWQRLGAPWSRGNSYCDRV